MMIHNALFRPVLWGFIAALAGAVQAQNTIGGVKKEVSQEEVMRQTAFLDAEKERMLGKYDQAIAAYRNFLYDNETNDAGWYGLARCYFEKKGYGTALETINKAIEYNPGNRWYYLFKADIFEKNGQHLYAAETYETLNKKFPGTPEFLERLAFLYTLAEQPKKAVKALDQLEALTGISEITASKKHLIYVALGDQKQAALALRQLADAYPSKPEYRKSLARFYEENGDKNQARAEWETITRRFPDDADARLALIQPGKNAGEAARVQALMPILKDPTAGIDTKLKEIIPLVSSLSPQSDPDLVSALLHAAATLEKVHPDDPKVWSFSGDIFYLLDRDNDALDRYQKCIALRPKVFAVWDNSAGILKKQSRYQELFALSEQAIDAFPNQPRAYWWNGIAANALKHPADALNVLNQAALMTGNNTGLLLDITEAAAQSQLLQQQPAAAIARLEPMLSKGGDRHAGVLEVLGDAWAANGDSAKATDYWKKAKAIKNSPALELKLKMP